MRPAIRRLRRCSPGGIDRAVNPLAERREALEGHDIDRFVEIERQPVLPRMRRQRLHTENMRLERLAEIEATHARTQLIGIERRPVSNSGMKRIPVPKAILLGDRFQRTGVGHIDPASGKGRSKSLRLRLESIEARQGGR